MKKLILRKQGLLKITFEAEKVKSYVEKGKSDAKMEIGSWES